MPPVYREPRRDPTRPAAGEPGAADDGDNQDAAIAISSYLDAKIQIYCARRPCLVESEPVEDVALIKSG